MWWQLQLFACFIITLKHAMYRVWGFPLWVIGVAVLILCVAEPSFSKSMKLAPSFFQAWFVGQAGLAVFGCIVSYLVGDAGLTLKHYIGMAFAILSGYLLIS
jgi:hypothetical protein